MSIQLTKNILHKIFFKTEINQSTISIFFHKITITHIILATSLTNTIVYNVNFWKKINKDITQLNLENLLFFISLFSLMTLLWIILFCFFTNIKRFKLFCSISCILSSAFMHLNGVGIIIDAPMITNIFESNIKEVTETINMDFILHITTLGIFPSILILAIPIKKEEVQRAFFLRLYILLTFIFITIVSTSINYKYTSFYLREHRDIRFLTVPFYPTYAAINFFQSKNLKIQSFIEIGTDAKKISYPRKRKIGVLIVGETARSDHFYLNGYAKNTTPYLSTINVYSYKNVFSCGTSTSYSLPCMFSFLGEDDFSKIKSSNSSNILDVLKTAKVKSIWIDNNSSCKGVCNGHESINLRDNIDSNSEFFYHGLYLDEVLIDHMKNMISRANKSDDLLIILHPLGSHGPAYYRRHPEIFSKFKPECRSNSPYTCKKSDVVNSYDNSILYTDYFIFKVVETLKEIAKTEEAFMLYVSDHGESLGENGVYLHGLPSSIAPPEQKHIPLITWFSKNFSFAPERTVDLRNPCLNNRFTHDYLSHTLLNLFDVKTHIYNPSLDLLRSKCDNAGRQPF
ncbi:putative phosphatidylethanolamine transferase Mcr-1 [Thalassocella blandensis]|nr:putative phosphatidylethanolamine transferase Mcr-1 [Thalassocella blandensis]